jgi:exonuclease SbcD
VGGVGEGSGERKSTRPGFAVPPCLPQTAQYIALGHLHRPQEIANAAAACYSGSLLQLDFGEAGQEKTVSIVEAHPRIGASVERVPVSGGRRLRTVHVTLDALAEHADRYGDDYLRVIVDLERPALALYERVREVLPNAPGHGFAVARRRPRRRAGDHGSVTPDVLLARFYAQKYGGAAMPEGLLALFNDLYWAEVERASA